MAGPGGVNQINIKNAEDAQRLTTQYAKTWRQNKCEQLVTKALSEIELQAKRGYGSISFNISGSGSKVSGMLIQEMETRGFRVSWHNKSTGDLIFRWIDMGQFDCEPG